MSTPTTDPRMETIENASRDDVIPGDHLTWTETKEFRGVTVTHRREGIAHDRDADGDWRTARSFCITLGEGEGITLTIRRPVQELPTKRETVIVPNDGHKTVEAEWGGHVWRTSEAVIGGDGRWHGVWRRDKDRRAVGSVAPEHIAAPTWKVADQ